MKKTVVTFFLILLTFTSIVFSGCEKREQPVILFLGDSIAEAIIGPSPLSERENIGYYGIVGQTNDFKYVNRSISGDRAIRMYEYITKPDDGASMTQTWIKDADIIHISMIGNDVLNPNDMGPMALAAFDGDLTELNRRIASAKEYIFKIGDFIRELNPDATIFFVKVYNPLFYGSPLVGEESLAELKRRGISEREFRNKTNELLDLANGVLDEYAEGKANVHVLETAVAFNEVFERDPKQGRKLIFGDGVHPSNEGHALLYGVTQEKLVDLGFTDEYQALRKYRALCIDRMKRLYSDSVDVQDVKRAINRAQTTAEVTEVYFRAVEGKTPIYC